jgi:membrane associated rhomboid family serine protease
MLPLADTAQQKRTPVVTMLLVAANFCAWGWELWLGIDRGPRVQASVIETHALVAKRIVAHWDDGQQWQTVLTHMFLHGGWAHVIGNMWFLWIFGGNVEDRIGAFRYLIFYLLAGFAAATVQVAVDPAAAVPMLGASGAISGVLGAYLILFPTAWVWSLVPWVVPVLPVPAVVFLVLWFAVQTMNGLGALALGETGGVAWWAHAGGFAAGVATIAWAQGARWVRRK